MKRLLCLLSALLLCLALTACGGDATDDSQEQDNTLPSQGTVLDVGERCPAIRLTEIDQNGYTDRTFDSVSAGKITVLNFWAYWCPPCVGELPHFDRVAREMAGEVDVVAIHCDAVEKAADFIGQNYPDSAIRFAMDPTGAIFNYYSALGGTGSIPYTVVLDTRGVICRTFVGAVDYATLSAAIQDCRG